MLGGLRNGGKNGEKDGVDERAGRRKKWLEWREGERERGARKDNKKQRVSER